MALADQLLDAIRPLWPKATQTLREDWNQSGLDGDDPELLGWLAGQIETLLVMPFLAQADLNISVADKYQAIADTGNLLPTSFALQLKDDVIPLTDESAARDLWRYRAESMKLLAISLRELREHTGTSFSPPDGRPRRWRRL